jgi:hypothetical protein
MHVFRTQAPVASQGIFDAAARRPIQSPIGVRCREIVAPNAPNDGVDVASRPSKTSGPAGAGLHRYGAWRLRALARRSTVQLGAFEDSNQSDHLELKLVRRTRAARSVMGQTCCRRSFPNCNASLQARRRRRHRRAQARCQGLQRGVHHRLSALCHRV